LIAFAMLIVFVIAALIREIPTETKIMVLAIELLSLVIVWQFLSLNTVVTATEFRIKMGFLKKRFDTTKLQVGQIRDVPKLAGIGIHYYRGFWVWNTSFGRGVSVYTDKGSEFLVGSQIPEQLQMALLQVSKRRV
jgi:hypothetical protein